MWKTLDHQWPKGKKAAIDALRVEALVKFSELLMFEFMTQRPLAGETLEASAPASDPGSSPAT